MGNIEMVVKQGILIPEMFIPLNIVYYVGFMVIVLAAVVSFYLTQKFILKPGGD